MQKEAFIIGDIHGNFDMLRQLLNYWQPQRQQLIFVGDIIDRGPDSFATIQLVRRLQRDSGAICLMGNHEHMLLEFLREPERCFALYKRNGGLTTVAQLLEVEMASIEESSGEELSQLLQAKHSWLREWLQQLPYYTEFGVFVVVHAGVDLTLADWRDSTPRDMIWIREPFHVAENTTGRTFVFGHTPVNHLHADQHNTSIWHQVGKIGIDGGAAYGGPLYGLVVNHQEVYNVIKIAHS